MTIARLLTEIDKTYLRPDKHRLAEARKRAKGRANRRAKKLSRPMNVRSEKSVFPAIAG